MPTDLPCRPNERIFRQQKGPLAAMIALLGAFVLAPEQMPALAAPSEKSVDLCAESALWIKPGGKASIPHAELISDLTEKKVVLLGESHDSAAHHSWQLHSLAALHGRKQELVIGFEMFPRRVQPVLDKWVRGKLSRKDFLKEADWHRIWGFNSELYMPLFDFARMHRIPMVALNIERALVARIGKEGWKAVPAKEREGVGDPAPALKEYRRSLGRIYSIKEKLKEFKPGEKPPAEIYEIEIDDKQLSALEKKDDFIRFVEAQLAWDRAMAEALAEASGKHPDALIVGVMGAGHVERGFGVPHQLADLDVAQTAALIPVETGENCREAEPDYADFLFTLDKEEDAKPKRLKLGVLLTQKEGRVEVGSVTSGSVAEEAGVKKGDHIVKAAGTDITGTGDLLRILARQAPGTWLPLQIERDGKTLDAVAKFPASESSKPEKPE